VQDFGDNLQKDQYGSWEGRKNLGAKLKYLYTKDWEQEDVYLTAEENPGKRKLCEQSSPQMGSLYSIGSLINIINFYGKKNISVTNFLKVNILLLLLF
jgi:hypothetical protein